MKTDLLSLGPDGRALQFTKGLRLIWINEIFWGRNKTKQFIAKHKWYDYEHI